MKLDKALKLAAKFCSKDKSRPNLLQPVAFGQYVYASNGRSAIRILVGDDARKNQNEGDFANNLAYSIDDLADDFRCLRVGQVDTEATELIKADFGKARINWRSEQVAEMRRAKEEARHVCPDCGKEFFEIDGAKVSEDYFDFDEDGFRFLVAVGYDDQRESAQLFDCRYLIPALDACGEGAFVAMKDRDVSFGMTCGRIICHDVGSEVWCIVEGVCRSSGDLTAEQLEKLDCHGELIARTRESL